MAKDDVIELDGTVTKILPSYKFLVELSTGHTITAYVSGKVRINLISIMTGDKVTVEISPYDLTRGRIVWRHKD